MGTAQLGHFRNQVFSVFASVCEHVEAPTPTWLINTQKEWNEVWKSREKAERKRLEQMRTPGQSQQTQPIDLVSPSHVSEMQVGAISARVLPTPDSVGAVEKLTGSPSLKGLSLLEVQRLALSWASVRPERCHLWILEHTIQSL
jgi:hypothetical protein